MPGYYIIFERPHVQEFLDYLFSHHNVAVWTAASRDYAYFVIKAALLDGHPERELDFVLHGDHTKMSRKLTGKPKALSLLWGRLPGYEKSNTVLIDDNNEVFRRQKRNVIPVPAFIAQDKGSEKDNYLTLLRDTLDPEVEDEAEASRMIPRQKKQ